MIDFTSTIRKYEQPHCSREKVEDESLALDLLPSLRDTQSLTFGPELGLRDPLQKLGSNEPEAINVIGTRIARALAKVREGSLEQWNSSQALQMASIIR